MSKSRGTSGGRKEGRSSGVSPKKKTTARKAAKKSDGVSRRGGEHTSSTGPKGPKKQTQ
jgi:hypothetical protein